MYYVHKLLLNICKFCNKFYIRSVIITFLLPTQVSCRWTIEWAIDCCLMPIERYFNYIITCTSYSRWDDDDVRFVLLDFFIVLVHWNNSRTVEMLLHWNTLSRFRANQSLLLLLNAACLAEKQQISCRDICSAMQ